MNKPSKIFSITFGVVVLIAIFWIVSILFLFTGVHKYVPDPVYSGDGSMVIIPSINYNKADNSTYLDVKIEVQDTHSRNTLYQVQTNASDRMVWSIHWIDQNTFQLDSSDIGSYCWKLADGAWNETGCP